MSPSRSILAALAIMTIPAFAQQSSTPTLDYEYFKANVQPVFITKRDGHARCISCHSLRPQMHMQLPADDSGTWSEENSRANFTMASAYVVPGNPDASRLLRHPLAAEAGGDPVHDGGKHWTSKGDPEWQRLAAWVNGATLEHPITPAPKLVPRIVQTNSAGDDVHIIDPATNRVVGEIHGIEVGHGAAAAPDGSRLYVSNEAESTLDVVDTLTLRVMNHVPLSGHPNNIAVTPDGRRVYVAIRQAPGAVDVVDTVAMMVVKTIATDGAMHNTFITPDGKYIVAGSIDGENTAIIDVATDEIVWTLYFDLGVRPLAFERNPDGSTRRMFVQLSGFNGFAVVDWASHEETARIELPKLAAGKKPVLEGGNESHGMAVTPDGSKLVVDSRLNSAIYVYSLPELKLIGSVDVGTSPDWVTLTPDGHTAYVANAGSNNVSAVDIDALKEITRIPVGQVPKRNITAMLP